MSALEDIERLLGSMTRAEKARLLQAVVRDLGFTWIAEAETSSVHALVAAVLDLVGPDPAPRTPQADPVRWTP